MYAVLMHINDLTDDSSLNPPAPCPPTNLMVTSSCQSNNISVSWQASQGSVSYMAVAENEQGHRWSCNTSSTSCQISGLLCGQQYQVYAVGIDENCFGDKSNIKVIRTGRCSNYYYYFWNILMELYLKENPKICNRIESTYKSAKLYFLQKSEVKTVHLITL